MKGKMQTTYGKIMKMNEKELRATLLDVYNAVNAPAMECNWIMFNQFVNNHYMADVEIHTSTLRNR